MKYFHIGVVFLAFIVPQNLAVETSTTKIPESTIVNAGDKVLAELAMKGGIRRLETVIVADVNNLLLNEGGGPFAMGITAFFPKNRSVYTLSSKYELNKLSKFIEDGADKDRLNVQFNQIFYTNITRPSSTRILGRYGTRTLAEKTYSLKSGLIVERTDKYLIVGTISCTSDDSTKRQNEMFEVAGQAITDISKHEFDISMLKKRVIKEGDSKKTSG